MSPVNLKKLLKKRDIAPIINDVLEAMAADIAIYDADDNFIFGNVSENSTVRKPIEADGVIHGWVSGSKGTETITSLITHIINRYLETKRLADEVLGRYKEINLFYQLSEKITANLDLPAVGELVIEEARRLIKTTSGSVMLLNESTGRLEIISAFGQATHTKLSLKPGDGIAGSVFLSGRGEIVNDVSVDSRFIAGSNRVSSIICAPLKTRDRVIGVVNFSHDEPIVYTAQHLQLLATLASQAAQAIENAVLHESKIKDAVARNEIEKGQKMQRDFLPDRIPLPDGWDLAALFKPARQVAGDFYDVFLLPNGHVGLVIADVCDKGVGSALFMALFRSLIRVFANQSQLQGSASTILEANKPTKDGGWTGESMLTNLTHLNILHAVSLTNDYVAENHSNLNMFATLFFGVLDPASGLLTYVNGGHEPLVILGADGVKSRLKPTGPAVGMLPHMKFRVHQAGLELGDILLGYTDGVTEAKSPASKFFTEGKLLSLLDKPFDSASELLNEIDASLVEHIADADQFDDITMLAVRRIPKLFAQNS